VFATVGETLHPSLKDSNGGFRCWLGRKSNQFQRILKIDKDSQKRSGKSDNTKEKTFP
jgi:hypothetical protein